MNEKRKTRSSAYQYLLVEKSFSNQMMEVFPENDSIQKKLNPFSYNEDILILEDRLKERLWEIISEHLTPRQLEIINLLKGGATQSETAKCLGVNQSSITKCISYDTLIYFNDKIMPIKKIWDIWQNDKNTISKMKIRCVNENTGEMTFTHIKGVMKGEEKNLIRLTLNSGKFIRASKDHKFFTKNGWLTLKDIITNDKIMVAVDNGIEAGYEQVKCWLDDGIEVTYDLEVNCPWHNFVGNQIIIHNSINGNIDYSSKDNGKASYGGIVKKLLKVVEGDQTIKEIKEKISDIRNNSWE